MEKTGVGVVGCGGIACNVHLPQLQTADGAVIAALCDIDEAQLKKAGDRFQIPEERRFRDYHDLIACSAVDAVDICTPNNSHCPIAMAAVVSGKPFCVEKPIGISYEEAQSLEQAARNAGLPSMVCFSYRFMPAVRHARQLMQSGAIGQVVQVYAQYLKASAYMTGRRLDWRFTQEIARYGVSGDLAVHIIDMIQFLVADFTGVFAQTGIAVKERLRLDSDVMARVDTDDYCNFLAELDGGIAAVFGVSRSAIGNRNHISVDIYGDKGALRFDLNKKNEIQICLDDGSGDNISMETITLQPDSAPSQMQTFIDIVRNEKTADAPTLADGVSCQKVLDALLDSAKMRQWIDL